MSDPSNLSWLEKISQAFLSEPKDTEQLIKVLRDAQHRDVLNIEALKMIEGVLSVSDRRVSDIMIPKSEMIVVDKDMPLTELLPIVIESAHSRFPVIDEHKEDVVGILLAKDLLPCLSEELSGNDYKFQIKEIIRPAIFVPDSKRLDILLNEFRNNRSHLAMVVDEYGKVSGLVTIEDVLEQIVGSIEDEHDVEEDILIRKHQDNLHSIKAITPIEEFNEYFKTQLDNEEFDTIGGLLMKAFGHLPQNGEQITLEGIDFTILQADKRRIQTVQTHYTITKA